MLSYRRATLSDVDMYYAWANDTEVRKNSYQSEAIPYTQHVSWFEKKINSPQSLLLVFEDTEKNAVGQVRIETQEKQAVIGISVNQQHRGKGYAVEMLQKASSAYFEIHPENFILAFIKKDNFASYKAFVAAGYKPLEEVEESGVLSYKLIKKNVPLPK